MRITAAYYHQLLIETLVSVTDCIDAVMMHTHICDVLICTTRGTIHNNRIVTEHPRVNMFAQTMVLVSMFC
jgi:hypothetical protein